MRIIYQKMLAAAALLSILLSGCSATGTADRESKSEDISSIQADIAEENKTYALLEALSALPGRVPGSENNEKATELICEQYRALGLEPLMSDDYLWPYAQTINGTSYSPNNVVGYIAGADESTAIVISCHFDAVEGSQGSVDNASGTAAMLRVAANLLAEAKRASVNIIFCAFNGEEQNYAGSRAFVEQLGEQYSQLLNINFDCVGMISGGNYMLGAASNDVGYALNQAVRPYLDEYGIGYGEYPVTSIRSDHLSFEMKDIPNINFTQGGILSVTHSENDTTDKISTENIDKLADCITDYLVSAYLVK